MDTVEFARWLASLGVGGVLGAFIFMFYRKDVKQFTELWQAQTTLLTTVVRDNTVATTSNNELLRSLHKRIDLLDGPLPHRHLQREP